MTINKVNKNYHSEIICIDQDTVSKSNYRKPRRGTLYINTDTCSYIDPHVT